MKLRHLFDVTLAVIPDMVGSASVSTLSVVGGVYNQSSQRFPLEVGAILVQALRSPPSLICGIFEEIVDLNCGTRVGYALVNFCAYPWCIFAFEI